MSNDKAVSDADAAQMLLFAIRCLSEAASAADGSAGSLERAHDILDKCREKVGAFPLLTPIYDAILCRAVVNNGQSQASSRRSDDGAFVYFMRREDGLIKIGYSHQPDVRLGQLEQQHQCKMVLLAKTAGAKKKESQLHKEFSCDRVNGEWFRESPELMQEILSHQI